MPGTGEGRPVISDVIISVARGTMRMLHTLDTRGTVREALGLASNTKTFPFSMAYCIFIRPLTCISSAIFLVYSLIVSTLLLGGRGMEVVYDDESMTEYMNAAVGVTPDRPILIPPDRSQTGKFPKCAHRSLPVLMPG